jgi:hypothetical protein
MSCVSSKRPHSTTTVSSCSVRGFWLERSNLFALGRDALEPEVELAIVISKSSDGILETGENKALLHQRGGGGEWGQFLTVP